MVAPWCASASWLKPEWPTRAWPTSAASRIAPKNSPRPLSRAHLTAAGSRGPRRRRRRPRRTPRTRWRARGPSSRLELAGEGVIGRLVVVRAADRADLPARRLTSEERADVLGEVDLGVGDVDLDVLYRAALEVEAGHRLRARLALLLLEGLHRAVAELRAGGRAVVVAEGGVEALGGRARLVAVVGGAAPGEGEREQGQSGAAALHGCGFVAAVACSCSARGDRGERLAGPDEVEPLVTGDRLVGHLPGGD